MKKTILYLILVLSALSLSSCNSVDEAHPTFFDVIGLPQSKFNSALELKIIENFTPLTVGEDIDLDATNNTNTLIQLVLDTNAKIYKLNSASEWIEVENKINYSGRIVNIPTKESDPLGEGSFWLIVRPDNCEPDEISDVRIVITGTVLDENGTPTSEIVGAYLDVTLEQ